MNLPFFNICEVPIENADRKIILLCVCVCLSICMLPCVYMSTQRSELIRRGCQISGIRVTEDFSVHMGAGH